MTIFNYLLKRRAFTKLFSFFIVFFLLAACSTIRRPVKQMAFASAAMKAADRERAERRAPDLYRRAELEFWDAKRAYLIKDYEKTLKASFQTKKLAERAEMKAALESLNEDFY